jgi:uncharacterized protein YecE (DUF72 family)
VRRKKQGAGQQTMIRVGASGFSDKDRVGPYYPPELNEQDWLAYYASEFSTCELNFTYDRLSNAKTLARMADKTPPGLFAIKALQGLTRVSLCP